MKNNILLPALLPSWPATAMLLWMIPGELLLAASSSSSAGPQITLIPSSGHVGDDVPLIGKGFIPDQDIIISIDGSSVLAYLSGWGWSLASNQRR